MGTATDSSKVKLAAMIAGAIIVIGFVCWFAWRTFNPPFAGQTVSAEAQATDDRLKELADKSHGNFGALSIGEQEEATKLAHGYPQMAIAALYKVRSK